MLALSDYLGQDVVSADGARLGRLADLAVRLDEPHPPVTRLRVRTRERAARVGLSLATMALLALCVGALAILTIL